MRKNSIKNTRINGEVQRELGRIISREIKAVSYTHLGGSGRHCYLMADAHRLSVPALPVLFPVPPLLEPPASSPAAL